MKIRKKREKGCSTPPTTFNAFRNAERFFKRESPSTISRNAFDADLVAWESSEDTYGKLRGVWTSGDGSQEVCYRVRMAGLESVSVGQSRWKGKGKALDEDYAIVIPRIPGLVFFPSILPEGLQRRLVRESLENARLPNLTSLDPHYRLPGDGLWNAWRKGRRHETVERIDTVSTPRNEGSPSNGDRITSKSGGGEQGSDERIQTATVEELVPKLRWSNVGYHYDWTTKVYDFARPFVPIPSIMLECCRSLAQNTPWEHVFGSSGTATLTREDQDDEEGEDWKRWRKDYEPDGGIVNFYQVKDTLTGHTDHSESDAVRPLVSLSLGHSAIFLVGGLTKDTPPLAILLRSGDGLIMSGKRGRRAYHGLPRVLADTLPDHLKSAAPLDLCASAIDISDRDEEQLVEDEEGWRIYGEYLESGARININVRSVF